MKHEVTRAELVEKIEKQEVKVTRWITERNKLKVQVIILPLRRVQTWLVK